MSPEERDYLKPLFMLFRPLCGNLTI